MDRVLRLRQHLQQSIERLAPSTQIPETAKEWRPYLALRYHLRRLPGIGASRAAAGAGRPPVVARAQSAAWTHWATLLWEDQLSNAGAPQTAQTEDARYEPGAPGNALVSNELSALGVEYSQTSICDVLDKALQSAGGLLAQHGVVIDCAPVDDHLVVLADATLLRQTLITCLSHAISPV